jgi:beta-lactam-binding protein with PASTA domain
MSGPRTDIRRRRTNYAFPIIIAVLVLLLIGGAIGAYEYVQHNKTTITSMPDLVGEKASTATKTLKADGFSVNTSYVKSKDKKYDVVATQPKANAHVAKGETITLELSEGVTTTPVLVRDYVGMSLANAESGLTAQKLGYKPLYVETAPSGNPVPDQVLSQNPPAGTKVQSGDIVVLTVLAPNSKYQLTDVDGETQVGATSALTAQGLAVNPNSGSACSNTVNSGLVLSTVPVAGSMVSQGSSVKLIVSNGPCQVVVPNVMGFTEAAASAAVSAPNVGLQPSYSINPADPCTGTQPVVDAQSDAPGSSATYGSTIDLSLCMETSPSGPTN